MTYVCPVCEEEFERVGEADRHYNNHKPSEYILTWKEDQAEETQEVVYNAEIGGFSIHDDVVKWMRDQGCERAQELTLPGEEYSDGSQRDEDGWRECVYPDSKEIRTDKHLIEAVKQGRTKELDIVEIPADVDWTITEYETGAEVIREMHRVWPGGKNARGSVR